MSVIRRTKELAAKELAEIYPIGSEWVHCGVPYTVWEVAGDPTAPFPFCAWVRLESSSGDQRMMFHDEAANLAEYYGS